MVITYLGIFLVVIDIDSVLGWKVKNFKEVIQNIIQVTWVYFDEKTEYGNER